MTIEEFIEELSIRALCLPAPGMIIPDIYPKRYGFQAYRVTIKRANCLESYSFPFFSTTPPYAVQVVRAMGLDAAWHEEGGDPEADESALLEAERIAAGWRKFLGDDLYERFMTEVELEPNPNY